MGGTVSCSKWKQLSWKWSKFEVFVTGQAFFEYLLLNQTTYQSGRYCQLSTVEFFPRGIPMTSAEAVFKKGREGEYPLSYCPPPLTLGTHGHGHGDNSNLNPLFLFSSHFNILQLQQRQQSDQTIIELRDLFQGLQNSRCQVKHVKYLIYSLSFVIIIHLSSTT